MNFTPSPILRSGLFHGTHPEKMHDPGACDSGADIDGDPGTVSKAQGNLLEYFLRHLKMGADVEHIDPPQRVAHKIQYSCQKAACQIDSRSFQKI